MKKSISICLLAITLIICSSAQATQTSTVTSEQVRLSMAIQRDIAIDKSKVDDRYEAQLHIAFCKRNPNHKRCKDWFGDPLPPIIVMHGVGN